MALILIIDDEPEVRGLLCRILADEGHRVIEADNGAVALKVIGRNQPDLVITDILMPDKDGIETIQEMRLLHPGLKIIAMTGGGRYQGFEYLDVAKALGADALLNKPFRAAQISALVADLMPRPPER